MQNAEGVIVDLYIPRKWYAFTFPFYILFCECFSLFSSWTNRILAANDFGSVQINVGNVDPVTGVFTKSSLPIAICGFSRSRVSSLMCNYYWILHVIKMIG